MNFVKVEPHAVKALMPEAEKQAAVRAMPAAERFPARLMSFCAECRRPVAVDKLNRYRHCR